MLVAKLIKNLKKITTITGRVKNRHELSCDELLFYDSSIMIHIQLAFLVSNHFALTRFTVRHYIFMSLHLSKERASITASMTAGFVLGVHVSECLGTV